VYQNHRKKLEKEDEKGWEGKVASKGYSNIKLI